MRKHILVTGGAGFIGSNLINTLLKNYIVIAFDNFDAFYPRKQKERNIKDFLNNPNFTLLEGDIRNMSDLEKILNVDVIIHLAAKTGVRPSITNPTIYESVNINGTQVLLEFAKKRKVQQFIFGSSSSVYGINNNGSWSEEEKSLMPISPYAYTKLFGERLGETYSKLYGIRFIALRFFTVYGPNQRPDLAIYRFFNFILRNEPVPIYGNGLTSRVYTFVDDIVNGIVNSIEYAASSFEIINLGDQTTVTLSELIEAIEKTCGKDAIIKRLLEQPGDVPHTYSNISKAQKLLNYCPSTVLSEGLRRCYEWHTKAFSND